MITITITMIMIIIMIIMTMIIIMIIMTMIVIMVIITTVLTLLSAAKRRGCFAGSPRAEFVTFSSPGKELGRNKHLSLMISNLIIFEWEMIFPWI